MRLILHPDPDPDRPGLFVATLDDRKITKSRQPVVDSARELLRLGYDPDTLLTAHHCTSTADSFAPLPIREWARWTYTEPASGRLKRQPWTPRPECPATRLGEAVERDCAPSGGQVPGAAVTPPATYEAGECGGHGAWGSVRHAPMIDAASQERTVPDAS